LISVFASAMLESVDSLVAVRGPPLKPSAALRLHRVAVREAAQRFRSTNPRVFGSAAHGSDEEGSDLDILVDALPGATLFDLGALQAELEDLLGVPVDLLTPSDLPPKLREAVLADAQPI
jgi:predicted nucleotidyltransferase